MLYTLLDDYLRTVQTRVEHEISDCTYIKYNLVVKRFKEAVANKPLKRLKQSDILAFKRHLQYTTKLSHNTLCNYLSKAKTIFSYAVDNNLIDNNPFRNITIRMEEQEINPLTNEELERIRTQSLPTERLIHARDCFVFAANTALAFSDMASIVPEDIREQDGVYYIKKRRIKTGIFYVIPLNNTAMEILRRYGFRLPLGSLQSYNLILKEIGKICGISKRLTSHLARHTAATLMLNAGISMEVVSKILGHSNLRMTAHYAKLMDKTILNTKIEF
jgi:site-specific recombinase XerD